jgi:colanic acid/amylovoran biosynthesis glycosyltransferase
MHLLNAKWSLPESPWVLHTAQVLGNITERWIEGQVLATERYSSRLMGLEGAPNTERQSHWLLVSDRVDLWLAYKGMFKSGGLSTAWLATTLGTNPPTAIHCHYGPLAAQQRWLARRLGCRYVASFYGHDATAHRFVDGPIWRRRYGKLFSAADAVLAEGPKMASRLVALGCSEANVRVVRLPADASGLVRCERPKADSFRVVIAGRFVEKKGFDTAIRAFARALKGRADAELLIIGGGELEAEYRRLVAESGIETQVKWAGRLPFEDFMSRVVTAHVGLFPSRTALNGDSEGGAPVTLIESQWLGVPSIVSDHDDLPFVTAPDGGLVLPALDVAQWAEALGSLYHDSTKLEQMSYAAREFAKTHHSPQANAQARERIYDGAG